MGDIEFHRNRYYESEQALNVIGSELEASTVLNETVGCGLVIDNYLNTVVDTRNTKYHSIMEMPSNVCYYDIKPYNHSFTAGDYVS